LLRGINVGGHTVKMDRLRGLFSELGLGNVRSYIQSGNVFFESDETDRQALRATIEGQLREALGYAVPACLRTAAELEQLLAQDPFAGVEVTPDTRLSVMFLAEPSRAALPVPQQSPDGAYELVGKTDTELFVVWRLRNGRPGSSYGFFEKLAGVPSTTRFWHTTAKILAAANGG
ncbi:MAG TPA: DUF1697 domain-containing protein, partial [Thermomicrobiaceae bacterium]|nr:DUF1697 domain-containing protein [Thermomicrobiaceae bacterium]